MNHCETPDIFQFKTIYEQKKFLRNRAKTFLKEYCSDSELMKQCSLSAFKSITESEEYKNAPCILAFMAMKDELSLDSILEDALKKGKRVAIPKISASDEETSVVNAETFSSDNEISAGDKKTFVPNAETFSSDNKTFVPETKCPSSETKSLAPETKHLSSDEETSVANKETFSSNNKTFVPKTKCLSNETKCLASKKNGSFSEQKLSPSNSMDFFYINNLSDASNLENAFKIREPNENLEKLDVSSLPENSFIFVPGLCFNLEGARLGRGKGYYDRFLNSLPKNKKFCICGVCFTICVTKAIPVDENDFYVNHLLTEYGFISVK